LIENAPWFATGRFFIVAASAACRSEATPDLLQKRNELSGFRPKNRIVINGALQYKRFVVTIISTIATEGGHYALSIA